MFNFFTAICFCLNKQRITKKRKKENLQNVLRLLGLCLPSWSVNCAIFHCRNSRKYLFLKSFYHSFFPWCDICLAVGCTISKVVVLSPYSLGAYNGIQQRPPAVCLFLSSNTRLDYIFFIINKKLSQKRINRIGNGASYDLCLKI